MNASFDLIWRLDDTRMSDLFRLTDDRMQWLRPFSSSPHAEASAIGRRMLRGVSTLERRNAITIRLSVGDETFRCMGVKVWERHLYV